MYRPLRPTSRYPKKLSLRSDFNFRTIGIPPIMGCFQGGIACMTSIVCSCGNAGKWFHLALLSGEGC